MLFRKNAQSDSTTREVKRGRGRPRKNPQPVEVSPSLVPTDKRLPRFFNKNLIIVLVILLLVSLVTYFYNQNRTNQRALEAYKNPTSNADINSLVKQVGKHILLPTGEEPTSLVLTEADLAKVKGQAFFDRAAVGDKVLIYNQAKKIILYRPSSDRVVEMAPLNTDTSQPTTGQ